MADRTEIKSVSEGSEREEVGSSLWGDHTGVQELAGDALTRGGGYFGRYDEVRENWPPTNKNSSLGLGTI